MKYLDRMLTNTSFRNQLIIIFGLGLLSLTIVSTLIISTLSSRIVEERLVNEGYSLTSTLATQSTLALLYESEETALDNINTMLSLPDVTAAQILDTSFIPLGSAGTGLHNRPDGSQQQTTLALIHEDRDHWGFMAPVFSENLENTENPYDDATDEKLLLGYVRLVMSKTTLNRMTRNILTYNIIVSIVMASILLLILLAVTEKVITPINRLAAAMRKAQQGEKDIRAELIGTIDVIEMESAFNAMMDVQEKREGSLKLARDQALESAKARGEFAANVSHELRTPINGILGMLELLVDMGLTRKQAEYVETAQTSGESLLKLIDEILDFSKNESGQSNLQVKNFSLPKILEDVVSLLSSQAQQKQLDLAYISTNDVPTNLIGDGDKIKQVLLNLGGNAVKFTKSGEIAIDVSVKESEQDRVVLRFTVKDTGIGISEDAQKRIFEAFSQADASTTRRYGGTGLGLSISRQLILLMGGDIGVNSETGMGSEFWFELPLLQASQPDQHKTETIGLNRRVLVIDDSALNLRLIEGLLSREPCNFELCQSSEQGVDLFQQAAAAGQGFDIVLVDEQLKDSKGIEVIRKMALADKPKQAQFILMTHRINSSPTQQSGLVVSYYLRKPLQRSEFYSCLSRLVRPSTSINTNEKESVLPSNKHKGVDFEPHILVTEDNRANQKVAVGMLERMGFLVDLAHNGKECLDAVMKNHYDLILMDCHMPEMDGYEASAKIRALKTGSSHLPIIAMTANIQQGEAEKCISAGMDDYLPKPLKMNVLRETLEKHLNIISSTSLNENPSHSHVDSEIINRNALIELHSQIGDVLYTMIQAYLEDLPIYLNALKEAIENNNTASFADVAHTIRGSSANYGAERLVGICQRLESIGRSGVTEGAEQMMVELLEESELVRHVLANEYQLSTSERPALDIEAITHEPSHQPTILIVDDDRGSRMAMAEVLRNEGYNVIEANDGREAIVCCKRTPPNVVLMDAIMPKIDGFTACSMIKNLPETRETPVLIITSLNDENSIGRAFSSGATDYISKPVNFSVLRQRIALLVQTNHAEQRVKRLAYKDMLTGLPNRTMFNERFNEMLTATRNKNQQLALMFLDLDRFKLINDTMGHEAGDLLLKYFGERMQNCMRKGDLVARFGGDEFTIILDNIDSAQTITGVVSKIHQQLSKPFVFMGKKIYVNTSIGISVFPEDGQEIGTLLKKADMAMYRAKENSQNYQFYEDHMQFQISKRLDLENDLRGALERDEMRVFYQPQIDLKTGKLHGKEALIRWHHSSRGLINPIDFIGLAEETGQIWEIGRWVLEQSCLQQKKWIDSGHNVTPMSVNLSGKQLTHPDLLDTLKDILRKTGLKPHYLELEITESTIMENPESVIITLEALKSMGVMLSIDDFGTGYSSLSYLKRFPIDIIKVDRMFISDLSANNVDADIVKTIIALAHIMDVRVVAEGVENQDQIDILKRHRCDIIQGYFIGKPTDSESFEKTFAGDKVLIDS